MESRTARWFIWRVLGLVGTPGSRWSRFLVDKNETVSEAPDQGDDPDRDI